MRIGFREPRGLLRGGLGLLLAALVPAGPGGGEGFAQVVPPGGARPDLQRQVQIQFERRVQAELGLTPAGRDSVQAVVAAFRPRRQALAIRERTLRQQSIQLLRGGGRGGPGDQARALEILAGIRSLREEEAQLAREEEERLLELLTPVQLLRFQILRQQMADRIRSLQVQPPPGT